MNAKDAEWHAATAEMAMDIERRTGPTFIGGAANVPVTFT
jgi:hypothetical protein